MKTGKMLLKSICSLFKKSSKPGEAETSLGKYYNSIIKSNKYAMQAADRGRMLNDLEMERRCGIILESLRKGKDADFVIRAFEGMGERGSREMFMKGRNLDHVDPEEFRKIKENYLQGVLAGAAEKEKLKEALTGLEVLSRSPFRKEGYNFGVPDNLPEFLEKNPELFPKDFIDGVKEIIARQSRTTPKSGWEQVKGFWASMSMHPK